MWRRLEGCFNPTQFGQPDTHVSKPRFAAVEVVLERGISLTCDPCVDRASVRCAVPAIQVTRRHLAGVHEVCA